ncbi:MAG: SLBB domain-containing protein [Candidatus Marinimicrobia bacterium]|nr:SLBB domain-containing protein [Candidatus Neomarinimicrobiota bacterium]
MRKKLLFISILLFASVCFGQSYSSGSGLSPGYNVNSNKLTFPVKIWGEVVRPGIYQIPLGWDMMSALSQAGGPTLDAKLTDVRVLRTQLGEGEKNVLIYVNVEKYIETGDQSLLPEIRAGDTIMISPKFGKKIGEFLNSFRGLMAIVQTAVMIEYYLGRSN